MASLQTNALLVTPNAANAAMKANTHAQTGDKDDFAALLKSDAPKPPVKNEAKAKPPASDSKPGTAALHGKGRHDNKAEKADRKSAKTDDAANARPVTAHAQPGKTDKDSDPADDADGTLEQAAADTAAPDQTAANQNNGDQSAAPADGQPVQPAQPQPPTAPTDATAQAQQMMAAAAPSTAAPKTSGKDDTAVAAANSASKSARGNAPPPAAAPETADAKAGDDTKDAGGKTAAVPGTAAQDGVKPAGRQDNKPHTDGDPAAVKADPAPQPQQAQAVPQPAAQPPAPPAIPNLAGVSASAAAPAGNGIAAAGHALSTSVNVAAQRPDVTPNVNSLGIEIAARSQSGAREFQIRLDPPELGHVEVRLSIDASGKTEAHMSADQQQTLDLLQKHAPSLTTALRDAGLDVSQNGLNFSLRGQDRQGSESGNGGGRMRGASLSLAATKSIDAVQSANPYLSSAGDARLDIHV